MEKQFDEKENFMSKITYDLLRDMEILKILGYDLNYKPGSNILIEEILANRPGLGRIP